MRRITTMVMLSVLLLVAARRASAATLHVNCGGKTGLTSIAAALKSLQSFGSTGPNTITVSGNCVENVTVQAMDRLTLDATAGASITDASAGSLDVLDVVDSRDVSVNNFTINGGSAAVNCLDRSLCRLNGNTIQGASLAGVAAYFSQIDVTGGVLQNNATGLLVYNGSEAKALGVTIRQNGGGIELRTHSFINTDAVVTGNSGSGIFATHDSTVNCIGCQVSGNGDHGVILRRNTTARIYGGAAITGNTGGGVLLSEESSAYFGTAGNVTGNPGGLDVSCAASATTAKLATVNIGGGTTNCVEPVDP